VLTFAPRFIEEHELDAMSSDPMALTQGLTSVGMAGIIDPLRAEAKSAFRTALGAGIDVRMITGDHAVTAEAIGEMLGLGPGVISGPQLQALPDEQLARRLPHLHVFGRVSPEDKLRLTVFNALTNRRDPASGLIPPILQAVAISVVPVVLLLLATEIGFLQRGLHTQALTGYEWLACIGLALTLPVVIEASKWIRRSQAPRAPGIEPARAVTPARARIGVRQP
jgi:hypothetical protein